MIFAIIALIILNIVQTVNNIRIQAKHEREMEAERSWRKNVILGYYARWDQEQVHFDPLLRPFVDWARERMENGQ